MSTNSNSRIADSISSSSGLGDETTSSDTFVTIETTKFNTKKERFEAVSGISGLGITRSDVSTNSEDDNCPSVIDFVISNDSSTMDANSKTTGTDEIAPVAEAMAKNHISYKSITTQNTDVNKVNAPITNDIGNSLSSSGLTDDDLAISKNSCTLNTCKKINLKADGIASISEDMAKSDTDKSYNSTTSDEENTTFNISITVQKINSTTIEEQYEVVSDNSASGTNKSYASTNSDDENTPSESGAAENDSAIPNSNNMAISNEIDLMSGGFATVSEDMTNSHISNTNENLNVSSTIHNTDNSHNSTASDEENTTFDISNPKINSTMNDEKYEAVRHNSTDSVPDAIAISSLNQSIENSDISTAARDIMIQLTSERSFISKPTNLSISARALRYDSRSQITIPRKTKRIFRKPERLEYFRRSQEIIMERKKKLEEAWYKEKTRSYDSLRH